MKKILNTGPTFIIIAALLWSLDGLLRTSLYSLSPIIVVFWEHVLGAVLLTPFVLPQWRLITSFTKKEWIAIAIVSLFSGAFGTIFYTAALGKVHYIQFSVVVLLQQLQPIWAIITASIVLREKMNKEFVVWAVIAVLASYLVTFKNLHLNFAQDAATIEAALMAVVAGMMWGSSTSFSKVALNKASFLFVTYLRFAITPLFALFFILIFGQTSQITHLNSSHWLTLLAITLSTGMVALLIYYFGLRKTPAKVSAICELVWPASAIFIGYVYFKQTLSFTQIIGVVITLISIYKVSQFKK